MSALKDFLAKTPAEHHALARALDALIVKAAPGLDTSLKWGNLTYSGNQIVCAIAVHKHHVNLQLWNGASLKDPRGLLIGESKKMRHLKFTTATDIKPKIITDFIKQAARLDDA